MLNIEKVTKLKAYECLTFLAYKKDLHKYRENERRRNKV